MAINFSAKEIEKIAQLRHRITEDFRLSESQSSDHQMIRWLRARNMDIDKAEEMLRKSLKWREEKKVDTILETFKPPESFLEQVPFAYLGDDPVTECPVFLYLMGRDDFRANIERYGFDVMNHVNTYFMEYVEKVILKKCSERAGRPVTQFIELIDLEGYSYSQLANSKCRQGLIQMQATMDNNYPELLCHVSMVNAPRVFYLLFNFMKPFVAKETLDKVSIYAPHGWKEDLAKRFPLDLIPPHWGGTRPGRDEYCSSDPNIWIFNLDKNFFKHLEPLKVKARDRIQLEYDVHHEGSSIVWKFKSENYDISFGILHGDEEVVPISRVNSHKEEQIGEFICQRIGKYFIIFDNSYSFTKDKNVHHRIEIVVPELVLAQMFD